MVQTHFTSKTISVEVGSYIFDIDVKFTFKLLQQR